MFLDGLDSLTCAWVMTGIQLPRCVTVGKQTLCWCHYYLEFLFTLSLLYAELYSRRHSSHLHIHLMKHIQLPTHFNHCCVSYINLFSEHVYTEEPSPIIFRMNSLTNVLMFIFTAYYMYNTRVHPFIHCNHMIVTRWSS